MVAKTTFSKNDVKAFVYKWFALFDHQADINEFIVYLPKQNMDMHYPDFPIKSREDFKRWYAGVIENIQWNYHNLKYLNVTGDEKNGFEVSLIVNWKAKTYSNEKYDLDVFQEWKVEVNKNREFVITKHKAFLVK